MQHGGEFWGTDVRHFNGGLFDDQSALSVTKEDADALVRAATLDWAQVEPAIFGTLFENILDTVTRSKRGAHYTSVPDILARTELNDHRLKPEVLKAQDSGLKVRLQTPYAPNTSCQLCTSFQFKDQPQHRAES